MNFCFRENSENIVSAYHKYKAHYDRKARAQPLKVNDFVFLLDPKYDSQKSKEELKTFHWKGPNKVMKVLSDSKYIIRKVGTHKTQCVHRMRLRLFKSDANIEDLSVSKQCYADNERVGDTDIFDSNIPRQRQVDQNENKNLDQDLVEEEPSEQPVNQQLKPRQNRSPDRTPEIHYRTDNPPIQIEFNNFKPLTSVLKHKKKLFYRLHTMKVG